MGKVGILTVKQTVYMELPRGVWTTEDTGIVVFPKGTQNIVDDKVRKQYDDAGIDYEMSNEVDQGEFMAFLKDYVASEPVKT